ncbi:hypothetical protein BH23BAC3_BH23BAC3_27070 [soil metagenome]
MKIKCSVFVAASLDGFIARKDGDVSWLESRDIKSEKLPGLRYDEFISSVDGIVLGRNTFEKVLTFGFWPYKGIPVTVLSSRELSFPGELQDKVNRKNGPPEMVVAQLLKEGRKHLYIDGGITIQRFLESGLIDEITITTIPVLLGDGIPLFGPTAKESKLRLIDINSSDNGVIQTRYSLKTHNIRNQSNEIEFYQFKNGELFSLIDKQTDKKVLFSNNYIEKIVGVAGTTRNWKTVNRIEMLSKEE